MADICAAGFGGLSAGGLADFPPTGWRTMSRRQLADFAPRDLADFAPAAKLTQLRWRGLADKCAAGDLAGEESEHFIQDSWPIY